MTEYIVSARKHRPASFDTVVGQTALTTTLKNAVKSGKLAHAYLFCGPRGVGKTTCARIFAKAINCQNISSDGEACNECESCKSFNEQRSFNIFELDAASNNSVEHIKTLMEQTRIPPQVGQYKVFIIDEVHMLSTAAFNAFLKTLEEPPAQVIFILATTEKHKILPTILSRCQIYDFERITVKDTIAHLKHIAEKEGVTYEEEALAVIAEKADGGMRDALSIFDQAVSFCQGSITYDKVVEDLNVLDAENFFHITDLAVDNKVSDIMVLLNNIINKGFDGGLLISGLARHTRNVLMAKDESTLPLLEVSEQQREKFKQQAKKCSTVYLYRALKVMNQCDINYRQSNNKRLLVELTLIEMAQITQPDDTPSSGRGPKRLKNLFKTLVQQTQPTQRAPQVASVAARTNTKTDAKQHQQPQNDNPTPTSEPTTAYNPNARQVLRGGANGIGNSWSSIREWQKARNATTSVVADAISSQTDDAAKEQNAFTQDDLEYQWISMCNRMTQQHSGIAARMKNMTPRLTTLPHIEVVVDNQLIMDQMQAIKGSIVNTMRLCLANDSIDMTLRMAEKHELEKILSRREQFEAMGKDNPSVNKLQRLLNLELAYEREQ